MLDYRRVNQKWWLIGHLCVRKSWCDIQPKATTMWLWWMERWVFLTGAQVEIFELMIPKWLGFWWPNKGVFHFSIGYLWHQIFCKAPPLSRVEPHRLGGSLYLGKLTWGLISCETEDTYREGEWFSLFKSHHWLDIRPPPFECAFHGFLFWSLSAKKMMTEKVDHGGKPRQWEPAKYHVFKDSLEDNPYLEEHTI